MERSGRGDSIQGKDVGIVVGCAGWSSFRPKSIWGDSWKSMFSGVLEAYSRIFDFVEVNSIFYRLPKPETARRWKSSVPERFNFSVKTPRSITHEKHFQNIEGEVETFIGIIRALKARFVLVQTPKSLKYSSDLEKRIRDFISIVDVPIALELRGWSREERMKLLDVGIIVVDPFAEEPFLQEIHYFRLHGSPPGKRMYNYKYTDKDLDRLKTTVLKLKGKKWVVFNNVWMCDDARRFKALIESEKSPGNPPS